MSDSLDEQRNPATPRLNRRGTIKQMDTVRALMPTLGLSAVSVSGYRQIADDLMNQPTVTVNNFIQANPTLPACANLQSRLY